MGKDKHDNRDEPLSPEDADMAREAESYPLEGAPGGGDPSQAAGDIGTRLFQLEVELADWRDKYLRAIADFQNYQRRAIQNEQVAKQQGISSVVQNVVTVLDHFDLALAHDVNNASAEQVIAGVRVIREELIKALTRAGVRIIEPQPNDDFQPGQHEAIMQQDVDGVESGRVAMMFQPGYAMGDRIIRAAKVSVAP